MNFTTQFNVGEHAWYMKDNKQTNVILSVPKIFSVHNNTDHP